MFSIFNLSTVSPQAFWRCNAKSLECTFNFSLLIRVQYARRRLEEHNTSLQGSKAQKSCEPLALMSCDHVSSTFFIVCIIFWLLLNKQTPNNTAHIQTPLNTTKSNMDNTERIPAEEIRWRSRSFLVLNLTGDFAHTCSVTELDKTVIKLWPQSISALISTTWITMDIQWIWIVWLQRGKYHFRFKCHHCTQSPMTYIYKILLCTKADEWKADVLRRCCMFLMKLVTQLCLTEHSVMEKYLLQITHVNKTEVFFFCTEIKKNWFSFFILPHATATPYSTVWVKHVHYLFIFFFL